MPADYNLPDPEPGNTYVNLHFTVPTIKNGVLGDLFIYQQEKLAFQAHYEQDEEDCSIVITSFEDNSSRLIDGEGNNYAPRFGKVWGVKFRELAHLSDDYRIIEGARAFSSFKCLKTGILSA
jgi:hypothetical protein